VDAAPGDAERLPVLEPDGIDEREPLDLTGVLQRIPDGEHAARGMPEQRDAADREVVEQRSRVRGELLEAVLVALRLARLAEADLVRGDHAPARFGEGPDGGLPGPGAEVLAVEE